MITKRKTAKKGSKKEKRESKKGKEECTRRQICVAPLSESIIGHIGRPQHIPLPLNEYPSTNLQGVHIIFNGKRRITRK